MALKRPPPLSLVAWACVALGVIWLLWLALGRREEIVNLLRAGSGDAATVAQLKQRGLDGAGAVYASVLNLLLELAVAVLFVAAGAALHLHRPFARRAALLACYAAAAVAALSTVLHVSVLAPTGQPIPVLPLVVNGLVTVAAVVLWGGLLQPEVEAAYAGPLPADARAG